MGLASNVASRLRELADRHDSKPGLLPIAQAAEACACSEKTIRRAIEREELRAFDLRRPGAKRALWRIPPEELPRWLESRANVAPPESTDGKHDAVSALVSTAPRGRRAARKAGVLVVEPAMGRRA